MRGLTAATVDEYLAGVPEPARSTLQKVRATLLSVMPAETVEVISYGMPTLKYKKVMLHFAAFTKHCSLFPGPAVIELFQDELKGYQLSKGTIQFAVDQAPPVALLKKIAKARLAEGEKKKPR
jgi:uncharacterized protein YdhG (YjbR/CyaY superfamily)